MEIDSLFWLAGSIILNSARYKRKFTIKGDEKKVFKLLKHTALHFYLWLGDHWKQSESPCNKCISPSLY